jgi:hypothetical protein
VRLGFVQRVQDERALPADALRQQIEADRRAADRLFSRFSV